jgi:transposase-like protein
MQSRAILPKMRRTYSDAEKAQALDLYQTDGPTVAAERTGIPRGTILSWSHRAGMQSACNENNAKAVEAARLTWEARRLEMVHRMGEVAADALELAAKMLDGESTSKAKDCATTMAILVDKAQLLAGGATSRNYNVTRDHVLEEARTKALTLVPNAA